MPENEKTVALIPIGGEGPQIDATVSSLPAPKPRRGFLYRIGVVFCAMLCLLCTAVIFVLTLSAVSRLDAKACVLQLTREAGLGILSVEITESMLSVDAPGFTLSEGEGADGSHETGVDAPPPEAEPNATAGAYPIVAADLSCGADILTLFNETGYTPDTASLLDAPLPFPRLREWKETYGDGVPYILILHTHGTEAYAPDGANTYTLSDPFRSSNPAENVVAVGDVMAEAFTAAGIPTLHCREMFDAVSYQDSYNRSAAAVRAYLAEYPSIQIILDVHRDSVIRSDMTKIRPVTTVNGADTAQFMIVAGTDFKGADFPHWEDNLNFALKIQSRLADKNASFTRATNLRGAAFHQQYRQGSLLLEVGSCGNTLTEAKRAGVLAAAAIAEVVTGEICTVSAQDILPPEESTGASGEQKPVRLSQILKDHIGTLLH